MWSELWPYFGDLHQTLAAHPVMMGVVLILASMASGTVVGLERESKDKPAGLRTVSLICVGSTIFTFASMYIGGDQPHDRGRIAAQIVSGIGFLGAGAIIRDRGTIVGLTTGATIWTVAAIGVLIGAGYAVAGFTLSLFVVAMLMFLERFERGIMDPCRWTTCRVTYQPDRGKTRVRIQRVLDRFRIPSDAVTFTSHGDLNTVTIRYCDSHRQHRSFLGRLVRVPHIVEFQGADNATKGPVSDR